MNGDASFTALRDAWPSNSSARMTSGPSKQEGPGRLNMAVDLGDQSPTLEPARVPLSKPSAEPRDGHPDDGARNSAESWPTRKHGHAPFPQTDDPRLRSDISRARPTTFRQRSFELTSFPIKHACLVPKLPRRIAKSPGTGSPPSRPPT